MIGRLKTRSYDDKDGNTRWVTEVEADEVSPSLKWASAEITRQRGGSGGQSSGSGSRSPASPPPSDDDVPF